MSKQKKFYSFIKILVTIPYVLALSLQDIFLQTPQEDPVFLVLWYDIFGRLSAGDVHTIVLSMKTIGFIFVFVLLFGNYISDYFGPIGVVLFVRVHNRKKWIIRKMLELILFSIACTLLFLLLHFVISVRQVTDIIINKQLVLVLILLFCTICPVLLIIGLIVNWIAITHGVSIGVVIAVLFTVSLESVAILAFDNPLNMMLNPLCFNVALIENTKWIINKGVINFMYLIVISCGMVLYVDNLDIWGKENQ